MKRKKICILTVVQNQSDFNQLHQNFLQIKNKSFHLTRQKNLLLTMDKSKAYDLIVIDSDLAAKLSKKKLSQIKSVYCRAAFIILVDQNEKYLGKKLEIFDTVDFLVRQAIDSKALERLLHFISEKKKIEDTLLYERMFINNLIDNIPDLIYFKDTKNRFLRINNTMTKLLDLNKPEEAWKKNENYFPLASGIREIFKDDEQIINKGVGYKNIECKQLWLDGRDRWVAKTKVPLFDSSHKLLGMFGIFRDITKQRITDEYLTHFTAKLNRVNRELQDFVFIASHDLQEPLRKIQAFGDLIKNRSYNLLDDQNKNNFDRIMNASQRMQTLLGDLLKYSRLVTKAQAIVKLNLKDVVQKVVSDMSLSIQKTHTIVQIENLPIIEADQNQMYELFRTLIQNAIKFRKEGQTPVIKIYNEFAKKNDKVIVNHCRIVISDNGIGFDEKYANRIFGVFQRLHSRNKYQGTGMGLAIARRIAERHMGNITVKSQEGKGSAFTVTLPLMQTEEEIIHDYQGKAD